MIPTYEPGDAFHISKFKYGICLASDIFLIFDRDPKRNDGGLIFSTVKEIENPKETHPISSWERDNVHETDENVIRAVRVVLDALSKKSP